MIDSGKYTGLQFDRINYNSKKFCNISFRKGNSKSSYEFLTLILMEGEPYIKIDPHVSGHNFPVKAPKVLF